MINSLYVLLSQDILMPVTLVDGKMLLLTLQTKEFTLSHPQQDMNKLLINQPML